MNLQEITDELEYCEGLRQAIKYQSMQYQFDLKMEVAEYYGLTYNEVNLPYEQWAYIRDKYNEIRKAAKR